MSEINNNEEIVIKDGIIYTGENSRASSGNMTTSNKYIVYWIECTQNSQNIANNTSNVTVRVHIRRTNTGYTTYGSGTVYCKINGTTYSASITSSQKITSSTITLFTKTMDISHASDGSKTLSMSAWISHSQFSSSEQYYSQTLTTIPRTSSISVTSSVVAGNAVSVTINRASSSFTHKVYYTFGGHSATISTSATTSASYTIPVWHCSAIPNSTSGTATIKCETWSGSTKIGETSKSFTITVPSSVKPSISSITSAVVDAGASTSFGYVQNKSKAKLTINGVSGAHGSTISSYNIWGGASGNSNPFTTGLLTSSGTVTFYANCTDSRGRVSDTKSVSITVNSYDPPKINSWSVQRCDSAGTSNPDGTYIKCTYNASISSLGNKNGKSYIIRSYRNTTQTGVYDFANHMTTYYSMSGSVILSSYDTSKSYTIQLEVYDSFTNSINKVNIPTAFMTMDFKRGGKGIAIGKVAETDNLFDVNMNTKISGNITTTINNKYNLGDSSNRWKTVYSVNSLNTSDELYKENIQYIEKIKNNDSITHEDLHEFYKNRYKVATYNYKEQEHTEYGFITQDMYDDKVGETLIIRSNKGDMYSTGSYITSIAGALQYEINLRDSQISQLNNKINNLEKLLSNLTNLPTNIPE